MKLKNKRRLIVSSMFLMMCSYMIFAVATVLQNDSSSSDDSYTYVDDNGDTVSFPSNAATADLASDEEVAGNSDDSLVLLTDVDETALITSLWYNDSDVTDAEALYDADWDLINGFETNTFTVGVDGSLSTASVFNVKISVTPFILTKEGNEIASSGAVTVTDVNGTGTYNTDDGVDTSLLGNVYYDPLESYTTNNNVSGKIVTFTLTTAEAETTLPAGRYKSTVTLEYSM